MSEEEGAAENSRLRHVQQLADQARADLDELTEGDGANRVTTGDTPNQVNESS